MHLLQINIKKEAVASSFERINLEKAVGGVLKRRENC